MGALTSRQNADVEETDVASNHAYKYPPKSGMHIHSLLVIDYNRFFLLLSNKLFYLLNGVDSTKINLFYVPTIT